MEDDENVLPPEEEGDALDDTAPPTAEGGDGTEMADEEIEEMKKRVLEMEEEAAKLRDMQSAVEQQMKESGGAAGGDPAASQEAKEDVDARSVYVGNVDYGATPEELQGHFTSCGTINRVTILCDKFSGHPKGFAYLEFAEKDSVNNAVVLDESLFRGRQIKVSAKRTNVPGQAAHRGRGRGRFNPYGGGGGGYGRFRPSRFRNRRAYYRPY